MSLKSKSHLRHMMNDKRQTVGDIARNTAAQNAAKFIGESDFFKQAQHIACYLARTEEFDTTPIVRMIWEAKKICYLPILASQQENALEFVAYEPNDKLELNRYRILEPINKSIYSPELLDLVLLPLVAFDYEGNRLGTGGGYYDRTFEFIKQSTAKKPLLIGVGYEFQRMKNLPQDAWDIPMDGIVTEKGVKIF